ncbi:hydrogenase maturation peptidase HycI [bacterium]|nr:hydrogenase maturation peptidase HycI [bacterium]
MSTSFKDLKVELSHLLLGRVLIVGIGNQLRADDGFGPALISRIQNKTTASCLDVGSSPENYIGKIVKLKPDVILFVDAVSMEEEPSTMRLIKAEQIPEYGFSTHNMSPRLMIDNIKSQIKTEIFMLGIEPENLEFGESISKNVLEKLVLIENILIEILGNNEITK